MSERPNPQYSDRKRSTGDDRGSSGSDSKIALCLSGGGFRAALFHLGALRRMNEVGVLSQVDTIAAVSGGSIIAAHLAERLRPWPEAGEVVEDWDRRVAYPFYAVTNHNFRTGPILRRYLLPWNWWEPGATADNLAARYGQSITRLKLADLPERPHFMFCATEMVLGRYWIADRPVQQHPDGAAYRDGAFHAPSNWSVAQAVAASTSLPPVFDPVPVDWSSEGNDEGESPSDHPSVKRLHVVDGGVFDNTGVSAVWDEFENGTGLVSSGGGTFDTGWKNNLIWRLVRTSRIIDDQAGVRLKRLLTEAFVEKRRQGAYWSIDATEDEYTQGGGGYSRDLVATLIEEIRTDLDAFTTAEKAVLENHGYLTAEGAIHSHTPELVRHDAPVNIPHPEWMDEDRVRDALRDSRTRKVLGRGWPISRRPLRGPRLAR